MASLATKYEVEEIVVGLPKNMNGTIGPRGEICIAFAEELRQSTELTCTPLGRKAYDGIR